MLATLPGLIEVTVAFAEAPQKLHVLLSEVWMHIRAENLGFTLALPRQPKRGQRIQAFALPSGTAFHFETLSLSKCKWSLLTAVCRLASAPVTSTVSIPVQVHAVPA